MAKKSKQKTQKQKQQIEKKQESSKEVTQLPLESFFRQWKYALGALIICYLLYVIWGLLSPYTWDDDCPNRYYHALEAWQNPGQLISMWNRPLWIWIFLLPAKLGTFSVPIVMSFLSVAGAYYLYKAADHLGMKYPLLAALFLLFQPFFMGVGRDAMTEPLAATLIAAGIYYSLKERYLIFAVLGALLPLARTELVVLLGLWAVVLFMKKKWQYIPILGLGLLLWSVMAWMINGDFFYILNQTIFKEAGENRYGNSEASIYFSRYFYIVGPVVFYYFIIGFITSLFKRRMDLLIFGQLFLGFTLYTLFAWKINLGNSAAFLRNLIPLSPLAALIACYGFNDCLDAFQKGSSKLKHLIIASVPLLLTLLFYRNRIAIHHKIQKDLDVWNLPLVFGLFLLTVIVFYGFQKHKREGIRLFAILTPLLMIIHTLVTEPPAINSTPERISIKRAADLLEQSGRLDRDIYCNHTFFYWSAGLDKTQEQFKILNMANLAMAPVGSIIVWETHYAHRIEGDVQLTALKMDTRNYVELFNVVDSRNAFQTYVFEKVEPGTIIINHLNDFIAKVPDAPEPVLSRVSQYIAEGRGQEALDDIDFAISVNPDYAVSYYEKGNLYIKGQQQENALPWFDKAIEKNDRLLSAHISKGIVLQQLERYSEAQPIFDRCVELNDRFSQSYYYRALNNLGLRRRPQACKDLKTAIELGRQEAQELFNKHCY